MPEVSWTAEQASALYIDPDNKDMLVSASAGSGKTAVLVERIIRMITEKDDPVDVDQLLVVTFTRAAAREMKGKIEAALEKRLSDRSLPDAVRERLRRQEIMVSHSHVMTIDAFCKELVTENFSMLDIDPGFDIADENQLRLLRADVIKELIEEKYREREQDFMDFSEMYAGDRPAGDVMERMITDLYEKSVTDPYPEEWLKRILEKTTVKDGDLLTVGAVAATYEEIKEKIFVFYTAAKEAEIKLLGSGAPDEVLLNITEIKDILHMLISKETFKELCECFPIKGLSNLSQKTAGVKDKALFEEGKKDIRTLRDDVYGLNEYFAMGGYETELKGTALADKAASFLVNMTLEFSDRYTDAKLSRNILDFSDVEHLALKLLTRKDENGIYPSQKALEIAETFREIMVDEYQDTNELQERILTSLKTDRNRFFMVGDVKQSIYGFRQADPGIFLEKYKLFSKEGQGTKIDLTSNFRSSSAVIDPVNRIFEEIMSEDVGEVDYDSSHALLRGRKDTLAEEGGKAFILRLIPSTEQGDLSVTERQALRIGEEIKRLTDPEKGFYIYDEKLGEKRPARFSDVGILLRGISGGKGEEMANMLSSMGIQSELDSTSGFLESYEVNLVLSFLALMDNMDQDIPMAAVMLSPIGGFSDDEILKIRKECTEGGLFRALEEASLKDTTWGTRAGAFLKSLYDTRKEKSLYPLHQYIDRIIEKYHLDEFVSAMPGGIRRSANLDLLVTRAAEYEAGTFKGLFYFLKYMERLKDDEAIDLGESIVSEENDSVKISTIHKSKGLEYPIVFVADMQKRFNMKDSGDTVLVDKDLGLGPKSYDLENRTVASGIVRRAIQRKLRNKVSHEEMRILYVALTRARDRLYMVGSAEDKKSRTQNSKDKGIFLWESFEDTKIPAAYLRDNPDYLDWIMPVALKAPELFEIRDLPDDEDWEKADADKSLITLKEILDIKGGEVFDPELLERLRKRSADYAFREDTDIRVKFTVSEIKKEMSAEEEEQIYFVPGIKDTDQEGKGARRGTAVHKVFEKLDLCRTYSAKQLEELISELAGKGLLDKEDKDLVDAEKISAFQETDIYRRMAEAQKAGTLLREQQFVISIPAKDIFPETSSGEYVLVQGVMDAVFKEDGQLIIVDYKTDKVEPGKEDVLKDRYRVQMEYYKRAAEMTTGLKVKEIVIYAAHTGKEVLMTGGEDGI